MSQKALRMTQQRQVKFVSHGVQNPQQVEQHAPAVPVEPKVDMDMDQQMNDNEEKKPSWMKKLQGVKKITNKEKRRRQNNNLRRLLTPKSALMVLNEIMSGEQLAFKVEPVQENVFNKKIDKNFSAEITIEGKTFQGLGESKAGARQAAAELAIRELIVARLSRLQEKDANQTNGDENMETNEEPMPMIQLASFALHKLFSEWEGTGLRVPHFKPSSTTPSANVSDSESAAGSCAAGASSAPKQTPVRTTLPEDAAGMHPCMLLTYMRPHTTYRVLACLGDKPQNYEYKMAVDVDGATFVGTGKNKKEARKQTAIAACTALFEVNFTL